MSLLTRTNWGRMLLVPGVPDLAPDPRQELTVKPVLDSVALGLEKGMKTPVDTTTDTAHPFERDDPERHSCLMP